MNLGKLTRAIGAVLAIAALGACAAIPSPTTGIIAGEVHAGPSVEYADAPIGTVIEANDGTILEQTHGGWLLHSPAGTVPAINAFWFDDPRPVLSGTHVYDSPDAVRQQLSAWQSFTPGASLTIRETAPLAMSGITGVLTVLGQERIRVPAGEFDTVHLRRWDRSNCGNCGTLTHINKQDIWFVPGTGVIQVKFVAVSGYAAPGSFEWNAVTIHKQ